jgi:hypothetical protein
LGNLAPTAYHEATQEYFAPPVGTSEPDTPPGVKSFDAVKQQLSPCSTYKE